MTSENPWFSSTTRTTWANVGWLAGTGVCVCPPPPQATLRTETKTRKHNAESQAARTDRNGEAPSGQADVNVKAASTSLPLSRLALFHIVFLYLDFQVLVLDVEP